MKNKVKIPIKIPLEIPVKIPMKNPLDKWLDSKTAFPDEIPPAPYTSIYTRDAYYGNEPSSVRPSHSVAHPGRDESSDSDLKYLSKRKFNYDPEYQDHIYIDPLSNIFHANMLFRMMIDYAYENNFDYVLHDPETKKPYHKFNLMDKELKYSFYNFCYENP
ncbi:MAG: hypothetical protein MUO21_09330 [Nitrososphaeraceae archaeon]|nr:hypothetical protein [Nitrososphaeraceae archaeon]